MLSSLRSRLLLLIVCLIALMAAYMIARSHEQRRISTEWVRTTVDDYAASAMHRQEEIISNARDALNTIATLPNVQNPSDPDCSAELANFLLGRRWYLGIAIVGPSGRVDCSAGRVGADDLAKRPSVRQAAETKGFAIGQFQIDRSTTRQFLDLSSPLRGGRGRVSMVVVVALDLARVGESIGSRLLPKGSFVDLVRTDGALVMRYVEQVQPGTQPLLGTLLYPGIRPDAFSRTWRAAGVDGEKWVYEAFGLPAGSGAFAGYAVIGIPMPAAMRSIAREEIRDLIGLAIVGLILLLGAYALADVLITAPIKKLIASCESIGAGQRRQGSGVDSRMGEFGTLAKSIDEMAAAIDAHERQIERRQRQLAESQQFAKLFSWRWVLATGDFELSDAACSILGITPSTAEITHEAIIGRAHVDDRDRITGQVAQAIASKGSYVVEYRVVRPDGDVRDFWERGQCETDATGAVVALNAIAQDITWLKETERARQRAMDALSRSEEQFRSAIEISPTGMGLVAPNGTWLFVNEVLCKMLGYSQAELLTKNWQAIAHPDETEGRGGFLLQMLDQRTDGYHAESRLVSKRGLTIWALVDASLVKTSSGAPRYFILQIHDISERKAFETALKASEEQYHRLLQAIPEAVIVRRNGRLEFANLAARQLVGTDMTSELAGKSLLDLVASDSGEAIGAKSLTVERKAIRGDGSCVDIEISECSYDDGNGQSVISILHDISLRKRGEQALRDSEEQLRLIADNLPILLARVDRNGCYLFLNSEGERRCAVSRTEVLGRSLSEVLGEDEFEKVKPHFERALLGESITFSTNICYPNGTQREVEAFYIPDLAPGGGVRGVFMVSIDVTDRKNAEAELRDSDRRFRLLVESTNAVPYTWSVAARRYTYLGPQAERIFGYPPELLADGLFWIQQIHPDDQREVIRHLDRLEVEPHNSQTEYRIVRSDGKTIWLNDTVTVETTGDGQKVGHGIIIDVTENKLRDRQIEQVQKIEALGQMTGGVAHDFNNLLTVIVINLELVARHVRRPAEQHRIAQAIRAANTGTELTGRMLAFARRQVLRPTIVDLSAMVSEFHCMLRRTLDESIETRMNLADDIGPVRVDRAALEAALLNLAVNARDAMPEGGTLKISTDNVVLDEASRSQRPELRVGTYSMVSVCDTGIGMTSEVLARVFEPFFTTKEVGKGTGLGLSMVYGFVKQSNGFIYIDSELGRGTTVRMYLPHAEIEEVRSAPGLQKPEGMPVGREKLLVVEDSAPVRIATASLLASLGYCVLQAGDGPSALDLIDEHLDIDLVLTDVVMPGGMKGPDLARRVLEQRPDMKLLYMSGYADDPSLREGNFEPYAELLSKPFHSDTLAVKVREVLDVRKASPRDRRRAK